MMNIKKLVVSTILLVTFATMYACTDHFEELNEPPTSVTQIDPGMVFTNVIRQDNREMGNYTWNQTRTWGAWVQHWAQVTGGDISPNYYQPDRRNEDSWWEWHYPNYLSDIDRVQSLLIDLTDGDESDPNIRSRLAIARIYEVGIWERLTASLGDIPYSDAIRGLESNTTPAYDPQSEIYPSLINQLDNNIAQLTVGDLSFESQDIIYQGDVEKWRKYGNTLKLRTALRMSNADPGAAETAVTDAMNSPLISNHDESAMMTTETAVPGFQAHPILAGWRTNIFTEAVLGEALVQTLIDFDDPRLTLIAEPTGDSKDAGCDPLNPDPNICEYRGGPTNQPADDYGDLQPDAFSWPAFDVWINENRANRIHNLHYAESLFLQAEAALRGWGGNFTDAQNYYEQGIRAALELEPYGEFIEESEIIAYLTQHGTLSADFDQALEQIMTQKWISLFSRSSEAYFEWRRTGYPVLDPGPGTDGVTDGEIPRRGLYHREESAVNSENLQEAINRQGPDHYSTRMWIDPE